jgi:serine/threonine protein phosphatase PrpC
VSFVRLRKEGVHMPAVDIALVQAYLANVWRALGNHDVTCARAHLAHAQELLPSPDPIPSAASMQLSVEVGLDPGIHRRGKPNEDFVFAHVGTNTQTETTYGLFVVADGMGGHADGQTASRLATQTVVDTLFPIVHGNALHLSLLGELLTQAVSQANRVIYERNRDQASSDVQLKDLMGTTITVAIIVDGQVFIANVGDSRAYLYRAGRGLRTVTRDHSVVANLVARGEISPEDIYTHPKRNHITRCLGAFPDIEADLFCESLQSGDILLLCTDGLWEMTRDSHIERVISSTPSTRKMAENLLSLALAGGGRDNIGLMVVQCQFDVAKLATIIVEPPVSLALPS